MNKTMEEPWFCDVKVGDMLHPKPLYNQTERGQNCLLVPTEVIEIIEGNSKTGVMFKVRTKGGGTRNLDAGWFKPTKRQREDKV